nr:truncated nef protein [Human immunodeficiency virus 1]
MGGKWSKRSGGGWSTVRAKMKRAEPAAEGWEQYLET